MEVIKIKGLTKIYGKNRGIENINLEIKEGDRYYGSYKNKRVN